jgi:hypothetical protein
MPRTQVKYYYFLYILDVIILLRSQSLCYFCVSCNLAICRDCTLTEHCPPAHQIETIDNVAEKQILSMECLMNEARTVRIWKYFVHANYSI